MGNIIKTSKSSLLNKLSLPGGKSTSFESAEEALERFDQELKGIPRILGLVDATGSMELHWQSAKRNIQTMIRRINEMGRFEMKWCAYRDYDHGEELFVASAWTDSARTLISFFDSIQTIGGETWEEAVEYALARAADEEVVSRIFLVGDAEPHPESDWKRQAKRLAELKRPVYAFVVGDHPDTFRTFSEISRIAGGVCTHLRSAQDLLDVVVLTAADDMGGAEKVKGYLEKYRKELSQGGKEFAHKLLQQSNNKGS